MRRLLCTSTVMAVTLAASISGTVMAAAGETLVVDDDGLQCGKQAYSTIADALKSAVNGDTIHVCPGRYGGGIRVSKSVSIVGPLAAMLGAGCTDPTADVLDNPDVTRVAVIEPAVPTTELAEPLVTLAAHDVVFTGVVLQGAVDKVPASIDNYPIYVPALGTDDNYAGYQIHGNLIRTSTLGVELGNSGAKPSRVHDNCLRENRWALSNQRETLTNATIDGNTTYTTEQIAYEIGWGLAGTKLVTLQDNTSLRDGTTVRVENAVSTVAAANTIIAPGARGFGIMGGNTGVEVRDNVVTGSPGIVSASQQGIAVFFNTNTRVPARSTGVVIDSNTISQMRTAAGLGVGIALATGTSTGAQIHDNILTNNAQAGLSIQDRNTDNVVRDNLSSANSGFGIRIQGTGSTNNTFVDNRMSGNGTDARDDTDNAALPGLQILSTWVDNKCETDMPEGALCED